MAEASPTKPTGSALIREPSPSGEIPESRATPSVSELARIIERAQHTIIGKDRDGVVTSWNRGAEKLYGYRAREIIGRPIDLLLPPDRKPELPLLLARLARGDEIEHYETERVTKSGKRIWVDLDLSPVRDDSGAVIGAAIVVHDISERKRAERELRQYQEQLEKMVQARTAELSDANARLAAANKELEAFAYSVSHDLRAPLRAIDGFSRILIEEYAEKFDDEGKRLVSVVRDSATKMNRLIEDILAFSRAGRVEMRRAPVDMEGLVRDVLGEDLATAFAGREVTIGIGPLPPAQGDEAMLRRVWTNLLDNAIKFTAGKAGARIEIGATSGEGGEEVFYVRDNGVGFDMQYAGKLFGVFQRLHGAEFSGTGIGLAIVKRIVSRQGGRVWAEGKPGEGATFYFALPKPGNA